MEDRLIRHPHLTALTVWGGAPVSTRNGLAVVVTLVGVGRAYRHRIKAEDELQCVQATVDERVAGLVRDAQCVESSNVAWPEYAPSSGPMVLRPFSPDDVEMARDMATDPYAPLIGTLPAYADEVQALAWIERQTERFTSGSGYSFAIAIAEADSGDALGVIGMMLRKHGRASVGYTVAPRARGRGAAGHALRAMCRFAWSLPELFRLEAYIEPWNVASIRTVEFAGFEREGMLRSYMAIGERRRDMAIYSCLRDSGAVTP